MAASIAYQAAPTGMAMGSVICWSIVFICCYRNPNGISQVKLHWPAPEIQPCLKGLLRLFLLAVQAIVSAVFNKMRTYITAIAVFLQRVGKILRAIND